ncbi:MAG: hypothetical protein ABR552_10560 [Actinomycetota bacterium]
MLKNYGRPTIIGLGFIVVGGILLGLGWNGAASKDYTQGQIPYLISGGLGGLALIGIGGALLLFESGRRARAHLEAKVDALIEAVREGRSSANGSASPSEAVPSSASANGSLVVVGRSSFHREDCRLVEGKDELDYASLAEAQSRGLQPCRVCDPLRSEEPVVASKRRRR